jgi:hypothetical protein
MIRSKLFLISNHFQSSDVIYEVVVYVHWYDSRIKLTELGCSDTITESRCLLLLFDIV